MTTKLLSSCCCHHVVVNHNLWLTWSCHHRLSQQDVYKLLFNWMDSKISMQRYQLNGFKDINWIELNWKMIQKSFSQYYLYFFEFNLNFIWFHLNPIIFTCHNIITWFYYVILYMFMLYYVIQTYIICILISFFLISVVPFVIKTPIKITTTTLKIKTHNNTTRSCFQLNNLFNWIELNVFESQIQLNESCKGNGRN